MSLWMCRHCHSLQGFSKDMRCFACGGPLEFATVEAHKPSPQVAAGTAQEPPQYAVDLAIEVSGWSPCRSKRGVVIFQAGCIVCYGYNYKPRGFDCDGSEACKATCNREAVHAEQQALLTAGASAGGAEMLHVKTVNGALVASGGPSCVQCSKLALVAGIAGVWLYHTTGWHRYEMAEFHRLSLAALPSAPAPLQSPAWQPIETCPKDGTWFLAWEYDCGFFVFRDGPGFISAEDPEPTHWMPLPAAPADALPEAQDDAKA